MQTMATMPLTFRMLIIDYIVGISSYNRVWVSINHIIRYFRQTYTNVFHIHSTIVVICIPYWIDIWFSISYAPFIYSLTHMHMHMHMHTQANKWLRNHWLVDLLHRFYTIHWAIHIYIPCWHIVEIPILEPVSQFDRCFSSQNSDINPGNTEANEKNISNVWLDLLLSNFYLIYSRTAGISITAWSRVPMGSFNTRQTTKRNDAESCVLRWVNWLFRNLVLKVNCDCLI